MLNAASPCPTPPPPVFDEPECPIVAPIVNGTLSPGCFNLDCDTWGASKAFDSLTRGVKSLAHTSWGQNPSIQLQLSSSFNANVSAVKLFARADCCKDQARDMNVYISVTAAFTGPNSALCAANVSMVTDGGMIMVLCPIMPWVAKYVTVVRNTSGNVLALQEIQPLYDGEAGSWTRGPPCQHWQACTESAVLPTAYCAGRANASQIQ